MSKDIQRQVAGILCSTVDESIAAQINEEYRKEQKERLMSGYYDEVHVKIHGRTAEQVKKEYEGIVPKSWSALQILRCHEPAVAVKVEEYNRKFRDYRDLKKEIEGNLY